ncbi:chemotaxis protein CheW [Hirschia baltica]|uniref:CheW protein n=1 Tax=Hirschia baltica (strain ATCC 49814 / DSM 5838 / IFAM 1418) TaxID=582402 RepID=C6XM19_HIRBI|nr:chemotaxis protein CheW [Hirschia baltica]ACT59851.1 CheW protein [Hirschia baltica ATCC 49814]
MNQSQMESDFSQDADRATEAPSPPRQYVSFTVGDACYAVDIMSVREIKGWADITSLPNQPDYVRGVLNLRGAVLPIIDLKCRLGETMTDPTQRHVIVIVSINERQIGLLVDAVSDILIVEDDQIKPVPETNVKKDADVFTGFLTEKDQMVAMLDLENLLVSQIREFDGSDIPTNQ